MTKAYAYCENSQCNYETEYMDIRDVIFQVCEDGGYISSDKEGGYYSLCPKCERKCLTLQCD